MLPTGKEYGYWPKSGEIDIMESRGNEDYVCYGHNFGHQRIGQTLHWGPDAARNKHMDTHWSQ